MDIIVLKVVSPPRSPELIRLMKRYISELGEISYLAAWSNNEGYYCTIEKLEDITHHFREISSLQMKEQGLLEMTIVLKSLKEMRHNSNILASPPMEIFENVCMSLKELQKSENKVKNLYWQIKELELNWLSLIRDYSRREKRHIPPIYIECCSFAVDIRLPQFQYLAGDYVWNPSAICVLENSKKIRRCGCCGCKEGCKRCINKDGHFLKIENNLAIFSGELSKDSYYWTYECSYSCFCKPHCQYNIIKNGRRVALVVLFDIYKGWTLRTMEDIRSGEFITEFLGEIVSRKESNRRCTSYQMELEYGFTLDCETFGNEARFISHSCSPNSAVVRVFGMKKSPLFCLAVIAKKDIPAGEEITIDYHPGDEEEEDELDVRIAGPCFCKSENCRKWL